MPQSWGTGDAAGESHIGQWLRPTPSYAELDALAGEYHSADAGATWQIAAERGRLFASINGGWRMPLDAAGPDRFAGGPWSLHFVHDPGGGVKGVELHRSRLWNLWFDRMK